MCKVLQHHPYFWELALAAVQLGSVNRVAKRCLTMMLLLTVCLKTADYPVSHCFSIYLCTYLCSNFCQQFLLGKGMILMEHFFPILFYLFANLNPLQFCLRCKILSSTVGKHMQLTCNSISYLNMHFSWSLSTAFVHEVVLEMDLQCMN